VTDQIPDEVRYNSVTYQIRRTKGKRLFTPSDFGMQPYMRETACRRGYFCIYEIASDALILSEMHISTKNPEVVNEKQPIRSDVRYFDFGYRNLQLRTPFTGTLLVARDLQREVETGTVPSVTTSMALEIHIDDGAVGSITPLTIPDFILKSKH
jgi:hypothetical protein